MEEDDSDDETNIKNSGHEDLEDDESELESEEGKWTVDILNSIVYEE